MNVLVTGGTGFIGSHTVVELINAGHSPVIIDDFSNSQKSVLDGIEKIVSKKIPFYEGDFRDMPLLSSVLNNEDIGGVIHFAAYKAVGESVEKPLRYYDNNVVGLVALLNLMEQESIQNLIFSSSCTVYGEADQLPVTELEPFKPASSPYGSSKQIGEIIIKDATTASDKLKSIALRYFNPIGAHQSGQIGELPNGTPSNLVPFVTQTAAGIRKELTVFGNDYPTPDGSNIRDYLHVVDLAKAHVQALEVVNSKNASFFDAYNIGTGKGTSVLELIDIFQKVTGQKVPYSIGRRREGDIVSIYASADKAEQELSWSSKLTLSEALRDAWKWQQELVERKKNKEAQ